MLLCTWFQCLLPYLVPSSSLKAEILQHPLLLFVLYLPTSSEAEQTIKCRAALPSPSLRLTGVLALQHVVGAKELSQVLLLVVPVPVLDHLLKLFHQHIALLITTPHIGKGPALTYFQSSAEPHNPLQDRQVAVILLRKLKPDRRNDQSPQLLVASHSHRPNPHPLLWGIVTSEG